LSLFFFFFPGGSALPAVSVFPLLLCDDEDAEDQGLTLVHISAQREHFLCHVVGCFAGFSDKNGSG
jgi:hypothetical protein